ncbi:hypothetical protein C0991_005252 [Blastosporella zonata]|nr:hypothetical protein C0991_005252 [Blastosporella zonata]
MLKARPRRESDHSDAYVQYLSRLQDDDREASHSKTRRSRPRSSTNCSNTLLRLLALETSRADAVQRQLDRENEAVLVHVQNIQAAHVRAEAELVRVQTELAMYKLQLDMAQKEILRAQTAIDDAEKARSEAEERGMKDQERVRELVLQRAIDDSREEGRREGWRLGLERGRWDAWASDADRRQRAFGRKETTSQVSSPTSSIDNAQGTPHAPHVSSLAVTPAPRRRPDAQISSDKRPSAPAARPAARPPSLATSRHSSKSRHSIPLDGFIPTLDSDAHISLPPPHELSMHVELSEPAVGSSRSVDTLGRSPRTTIRYGDHGDSPRKAGPSDCHMTPPRVERIPDGNGGPARHGQDTPVLATASHRSTQISGFAIVSQPPEPQARSLAQANIVAPPSGQGRNLTPDTGVPYLPAPARRMSHIYRTDAPSPEVANIHRQADLFESRATVQRSTSNMTVPGIDIEPPSPSPTNSSPATIIDPILLTPDHANQPMALPDAASPRHRQHAESLLEPIIFNKLPAGFVPLSPIPHTTGFQNLSQHGMKSQGDNLSQRHHIYSGSALNDTSQSARNNHNVERPRGLELNFSPAPLNRPFSIFSDD